MKLALQAQLEKTPWLDKETKQYAKEKLEHVTFKMGYPDWMSNQAVVSCSFLTIYNRDMFLLMQINNGRVFFAVYCHVF